MTKLIVDVNNRKMRADTKVYSSSVLEQVKTKDKNRIENAWVNCIER